MRYRQLGASELRVSIIALGCWAFGGHGWGRVDERESIDAIRAALSVGINFFDTADIYGFGRSEEVLGKALRLEPDALVATKVGLRVGEDGRVVHDLTSDHIRSACESSLSRLGRERIDLYQVHWPDPAISVTEVLPVLTSLIDAGKIRYIGASNLAVDDLNVLAEFPEFVAYQDRFNLLQRQTAESLIPLCAKHNIGYIAYEPLLKGILSGKYHSRPSFGRKDHRRNLEIFNEGFDQINSQVDLLRAAARRHQIDPGTLALALLLDQATVAAPGAKTTDQVTQNAHAAEIDRSLVDAIRAELRPLFAQTYNREVQ